MEYYLSITTGVNEIVALPTSSKDDTRVLDRWTALQALGSTCGNKNNKLD